MYECRVTYQNLGGWSPRIITTSTTQSFLNTNDNEFQVQEVMCKGAVSRQRQFGPQTLENNKKVVILTLFYDSEELAGSIPA